MDTETLLLNFGIVADTTAGIGRLRDLVLDLAVRGRLVPQDPDEESVAKGLQAILAEKGPTLASGFRGGASTPRKPEATGLSAALPLGWCCARIDDTGEYVNGLAFKHSDWRPRGTPIIRIQNLTDPEAPFNYADGPFPEARVAHDGDILVSWSATLNAFRWHRGVGVVNQHIFKVVPDERVVTNDFLFLLLRHSIQTMAASEAAHGLVMQHINRGPFLSFAVGLPPLREQERIAQRAQELLLLCDELEAQLVHRRQSVNRARSSAFEALAAAQTQSERQLDWARISHNWADFLDRSDDVDALRHTIRRLAVDGLLMAQDGNDSPASEELKAALMTKAAMTQTARRQQALQREDGPSSNSLPDGWAWARLDDVCLVSGGLQKSAKRQARENHFPYLRVANVQRGRLDLGEIARFELFEGELARLKLEPGDLLVVEGNGSAGEIGRCALWNGEIEDCVHQNHIIRCRPLVPGLEHFILLFLNSPSGMDTMRDLAVTTSGLYNLSVSKIRSIVFPMPPAAERTRILAKVDELMLLCDALERSLKGSAALADAAAAAIVDHLPKNDDRVAGPLVHRVAANWS